MLVSRNKSDKGGGNAASSQPLISRNGQTIIFTSRASDLVAGDYNNLPDLFYVRLDEPFVDTDSDGMDDDWERMWFADLFRSGQDDYDGDGESDLDEFLAGTNPTLKPYSLKITQLIPRTAVNPTVLWLALPGRTYQVQYKDDFNDPIWSSLEGAVYSIGYSASKIDFTAAGRSQRFYRVFLP